MDISLSSWLVGANGVYRGSPTSKWQRIGEFDYHTNVLLPFDDRIVAGVGCGVWEINPTGESWKQLHDETVTEVLALARADGYLGFIIGSPYGIASPFSQDGVVRWQFHSDDLNVNERFTNVLCRMGDGRRYLAGTEAGVLLFDAETSSFRRTSLTGVPVRTVIAVGGEYFAGSDGRGVWVSSDGESWRPSGVGIDEETVLGLAADGERIVAGTDRGVLSNDGWGHWGACGPSVLVSSVAADPANPGHWIIGAEPGGLWWTDDAGDTWRQSGSFTAAGEVIALPEAGQAARSGE